MDSEENEKLVTPPNSLPSLKQGEGKEAENTKGMSGVATKGDSRPSLQERTPGIRTRVGALREISGEPCMHSPRVLKRIKNKEETTLLG